MKIKKVFRPGLNPNTDLESGTMSFATWERIKPFLDMIFDISKSQEDIVGIIVTEDGIKAKIEFKK